MLAAFPAFAVVAAVAVIPILLGIWLSFTNYQPLSPSLRWAGLTNYDGIVRGPNALFAHTAILNTLIFVGGAIAVETILGVAIAVILARKFRGVLFFRAIFVIPLMVNGVASTVTWRSLFSTSNGWINYFLGAVGLGQPNWLGNGHLAMPTIIFIDAWAGVPIVAIIVMAGILMLPPDPMEAARIDGASAIGVFRHIVLPAIQPVLAFAVMFRLIDLFRQFAEFQLITGGGPGLTTTVLNFYVYQETFVNGDIGFGAALAVLLVVMMVIPLAILYRFTRRGV
ncbi:MAG: transporter permease [Acidimicrobiaceae bacterium]|nr:transporter permease [Acidimicrobiaceae bacterium]